MGTTEMTENTTNIQAFKLKGRLYTFTVLQVLDSNPHHFSEHLIQTIQKAPKLFDRTPIVFDLSQVNPETCDLSSLCQIAKQQGIIPVAIQGGNILQETLAQAQGLAVLNASSSQDKTIIDEPLEEEIQPISPLNQLPSKLITTPVRSGKQVVAKGGDLTVIASVSPGAELLADGCIHVYGTLRGRALAGISGNKEARIFCQALDAELVAIAGCYRLSDAITPINSPCQIYLLDDHIQIETL